MAKKPEPKPEPRHRWLNLNGHGDSVQIMEVPNGVVIACEYGVTFVPGCTRVGFELEDVD